jgi:hypothetical protein
MRIGHPSGQHERPWKPDDCDEHDSNPPMITGQLSCRGGREQLERDTADDNHDIGCGVDTDPTDQATRVPPPGRAILGVFRGAGAFPSQALERFNSAGSNCLHELLEVLIVLIGVALGELGDRSVERVVVAEVLADGDRIP